MNKEEISAKVCEIVVDQNCLDKEEVKAEANLKEDLALDSLDIVELTMKCEKEFNVTIKDEEAEAIVTVGDITNLVDKKINS